MQVLFSGFASDVYSMRAVMRVCESLADPFTSLSSFLSDNPLMPTTQIGSLKFVLFYSVRAQRLLLSMKRATFSSANIYCVLLLGVRNEAIPISVSRASLQNLRVVNEHHQD
jgi:hypothetical protein